jgi:hypothetical protein
VCTPPIISGVLRVASGPKHNMQSLSSEVDHVAY